ncbi:MAG: trimeric porin PorB [Neisseria sp.]|nr:trimeric porin PorB [Neisseria sp.]
MKKTLIALSLAALSSAAVADVTLYGQIRAGVEVSKTKVKSEGVAAVKSHTATEIADFGSRIGFKGHESLGNGVNAIWKLEQRASVAGNSAGWATREGYIGVETQAGTVRAGKIATQLDDMGNVDPWLFSNKALGLATFGRHGEKVVSVRYDSPVVAGFSGNVQFTPRDNVNPDDKHTRGVKTKAAYYAGLNYANAGFFAQYGVAFKKNAQNDRDSQVHRLEAGYDANNLFVGVGAQYTNRAETVADYVENFAGDAPFAVTANGMNVGAYAAKTTEVAATVAYRLGNVTPKLSYAHGFDAKVKLADEQGKERNVKAKGSKYNQVVVGADYDFSKRTTAFAQAGWLRAGSSKNYAETTAGLVGLRHKF